MYVNNANSVGEALSHGLHALRVHGIKQPSRVGDVLVMPRPVLTVYHNPTNRVLFSPLRDANPFFHVMEALWMLAGRNDLPWLAQFNKQMARYSDDGGNTQPGAYGYRWRHHFGYDQLETLIVELRNNPHTRRAVLTMWDAKPDGDLIDGIAGSADVPCNTHIYFDTIGGVLNMTVACRSNDIWWGAYGANAVHFSFLLEYVSAMTGIPMGQHRQFSNNFHLYTNVVAEEQLMPIARDVDQTDRYFHWTGYGREDLERPLRKIDLIDPALYGTCSLEPVSAIEAWLSNPDETSESVPFLARVAKPMFYAWQAHKAKDYAEAEHIAEGIRAEDWRIACTDWLRRRAVKHNVNSKPFTAQIEDK